MEIQHSPGREDFAAAAAGPACVSSMGLHMVSQASGALEGLVTELAVCLPRLDIRDYKGNILTGDPSTHPHLLANQDVL